MLPRLNSLVKNAATGVPAGVISDQLAISFATNDKGVLLIVQAFAPLLQKYHPTL
jgi:hypothetical protein